MRNDLYRFAEKLATPFFFNDFEIDLTRGVIGLSCQRSVCESLVMAKIQIGFAAVVQDIHFAMLVGAHRSRIDIDVRIKFLHPHAEPSLFKEHSDRRTG